jgi:hypothetical protein
MSGLLLELEVMLPDGEGVFLAVQDKKPGEERMTVALAVGTKFRASRVTMTEQDLRDLISKGKQALHFLTSKKG